VGQSLGRPCRWTDGRFFSYPQAAGRLPHLSGAKRTLMTYSVAKLNVEQQTPTPHVLRRHARTTPRLSSPSSGVRAVTRHCRVGQRRHIRAPAAACAIPQTKQLLAHALVHSPPRRSGRKHKRHAQPFPYFFDLDQPGLPPSVSSFVVRRQNASRHCVRAARTRKITDLPPARDRNEAE